MPHKVFLFGGKKARYGEDSALDVLTTRFPERHQT